MFTSSHAVHAAPRDPPPAARMPGGWRDQGDFSAAIDVGTTIYGAVQTVFALQFLYAAYIMRSDVLLALRRKLRAISTARPTARVLFRAQRDARARARRGSRRALPRVGEAQARALAPSRAKHTARRCATTSRRWARGSRSPASS